MLMFKVWNQTRKIKVFVPLLEDNGDLLENLILKASEKMDINGAVLCLESDGTRIEDSEVLRAMDKEIIMLLQPGELWHSIGETESSSTISVTSDLNMSFSSTELNDDGAKDTVTAEINLEEQAPSENSWKRFTIPWHKMKMQTLNDCKKDIRNKRSIADVIHVTADAMRQIKMNVPSKAIKIIANKIISKYPKVFQDVDEDNVVLGDGSHSVFAKLKEHLKYLKRPHKRLGEQIDIPLGKKKKMLASKAGCKNWQPDITEKSVEELQIELKQYKEKTEDVILTMLEKTYPHQRAYFNSMECPTIQNIREDWPILLTHFGLAWHYKKLMGHEITKLTENMSAKAEKIISFGVKRKLIVGTASDEDENNHKKILKVFAKYFNENINYIHQNVHDETEIRSFANNAPYIAEFGTDSSNYVTIMEQKQIISSNSFKEAIENMFALYYMLNLEYPKQAANTLETMQRYFLKIHPDQGTKNKKSGKAKLIGLLTKLRDF